MIDVYYAPPSIYGRKVLSVLEEKGLDYQIKKMSFQAREFDGEEYKKLNPNGEVPTLVDDGFVVYESTAIIEYLNDEYPEPPLLGEDSVSRARARMVEDYCDLHFYRDLIRCFIKKAVKEEPLTEEDAKPLQTHLKRLESYLGSQSFIAGDFSLADCAVMTGLASLEALGLNLPVSKPLEDYFKRLKSRPGYKGANLMSFEALASKS